MRKLSSFLESHYQSFNRKKYISPDPLELVYEYDKPADREVVGLIASSLALGRVRSIVDCTRSVLKTLPNPAKDLLESGVESIRERIAGFRYRFFSEEDLAEMLIGISGALKEFGGLERCFLSQLGQEDSTTVPALTGFVRSIQSYSGGKLKMLPDPARGSACKRLHLFLRWMVRSDDVDPGLWTTISPSILVVPMDVHMHRIAVELGLTKRKQANLKTAIEVTSRFKAIRPDDPVRYDFCLTRIGIHPDVQSFVF